MQAAVSAREWIEHDPDAGDRAELRDLVDRAESGDQRAVDDLVGSDFGRKLMADSEGVCLLSRDELRSVARDVKRVRFTYGETLMHQNDQGESFYVLVQGNVKGSIANTDAARPIEAVGEAIWDAVSSRLPLHA